MIPVDERPDCTKEGMEFIEGLAWKGVLPHVPRRKELLATLVGASLLLTLQKALH